MVDDPAVDDPAEDPVEDPVEEASVLEGAVVEASVAVAPGEALSLSRPAVMVTGV